MSVERFDPAIDPAVTFEGGHLVKPKTKGKLVRVKMQHAPRRTVIDDVLDILNSHAAIAERIGRALK